MASEPTAAYNTNNDPAISGFVLAESFNRANIQHRLYYVMDKSSLNNVKAQFGDRAYIIKEGATYYMGNDDKWYTNLGNVVI